MRSDISNIGLLRLIMAGALGSMLGTLFLESIRGKKPIMGWAFLVGLVFIFSRVGHHPLMTRKIESLPQPSNTNSIT